MHITRVKAAVAALFAGVFLFGFTAAPATAQVQQDGLVNVNVGDVNVLNNANVAVAAGVAATLCDIDVGPLALAVLGQAIAVDNSGRSRTICTTESGPVTITQNQ